MKKFSLESLYSTYLKNQKAFNYGLIAMIIILGSIYYYFQVYKPEKEKKADEAIFMAQKYFEIDSFNLALNGSGNVKGFNYIIKNFPNTNACNLANYYSGVIYLKQGEFKKAIDKLKDFSSNSNFLNLYSQSLLADAYSELKNYDKAINIYKEVSNKFKDNGEMSAQILIKAAILLEIQNKKNEAIEIYKTIINDFAYTSQKQIAEKYLVNLQ